MGLLSSVLSVGGAALGGAIGGPAGAKLGASIGGAAGGALSSSKASKKATKAQLAALEEARKIQGQAYTDVKGFQQPYMDFGSSSMNALTSRLGLPQPAAAVAPTNNALTGGPIGTTGGPVSSVQPNPAAPGTFADERFPPPGPAPAVAAAPPSTDAPVQTMAAPAPATAPAAPGVDPGTYGSTANPTAPGAFSYGEADYKESPALKAALARATDVVQSSAAAGGRLFSGATQKELSDRAYQIALGDFNQERQFNYGLNRDARSDYETDRGYLTGRFDRQTDNLFRGTSVGQGAAGVVSSAASRYGDQVAGLVTEGGQVRAQNALTQGQIGSDFATGLGGILAGAIGGGSAPTVARNADMNGLGQVNYGNSLRMTSPYRF
ncbi:MAG: hypothetical protein JHD15_07115 [Phenylobacterium sp.]|uniref:hypothetical protein n=1 Tax=Phenylobacterium sp. TaxID=1871053 RepID=UPI001A25F3C0|nr:hypothetical protein [Phenylobacterium sp.]MBJ7410123.1 hypothetical protein [Phenylobacterium sp.]